MDLYIRNDPFENNITINNTSKEIKTKTRAAVT